MSNTPDETGGTCPNNYPKCDPAEEYPHAAQWATDNQVYFNYQMPNWAFNEIGDLLGIKTPTIDKILSEVERKISKNY